MSKNELKKQEEDLQRKINAMILQAKSAGIPAFLLSFREEGGGAAIHFENMPIADAVNISANAWIRAMELNVERNPQYSKEYAGFFTDAIEEFKAVVRKLNKKVEDHKVKQEE